MYVRTIKIRNYRNYDQTEINLNKGINIFIGNNGSGKTNLLDSLYFLSLARSHKKIKNNMLIGKNEDFAIIELTDNKSQIFKTIITENDKSFYCNELKYDKISKVVGKINTVLFTPDDILLFKFPPKQRRRFLDQELCKLDEKYLTSIINSKNLLEKKKGILRKNNINDNDVIYLRTLNIEIAKAHSYILESRHNFVTKMNVLIESNYQKIANTSDKINLKYISSYKVKSFENTHLFNEITAILDESLEQEIKFKTIKVGIQRDDLCAYINNEDIIEVGSQGENRSLILALKLSLIEIIKNCLGEYPILLLDDVLSELDQDRKNKLVNLLLKTDIQVIITTTSFDKIHDKLLQKAKILFILDGKVKE